MTSLGGEFHCIFFYNGLKGIVVFKYFYMLFVAWLIVLEMFYGAN